MPEHAWPDGSSGGNGGGAGGDWEIVFRQDITGGEPFPINTGIFYDPDYEWVVANGANNGVAVTPSEFLNITIHRGINFTPQNVQIWSVYSPDGVATHSSTLSTWIKEKNTLDASFGLLGALAIPRVDLDFSTGEFIISGTGGPPNPGYAVIARRRSP
jgi:hypothetical protein